MLSVIALFTLNSTTGALRLASNLTGLNGLYWLTIEARDLGTESLATKLNVTIKIQDYNDHKPAIVAPTPQSVFVIAEVRDQQCSPFRSYQRVSCISEQLQRLLCHRENQRNRRRRRRECRVEVCAEAAVYE